MGAAYSLNTRALLLRHGTWQLLLYQIAHPCLFREQIYPLSTLLGCFIKMESFPACQCVLGTHNVIQEILAEV